MAPRPTSPRDLFTVDRSDRVAAGVLLGLVSLGTLVAQVGVPLVRWGTGRGLPVDYLGALVAPALDSAGVSYEREGVVRAVVADPTTTTRLVDLLPGVLVTAAVAVGCWLVLRLTADIVDREAFTRRNVVRLRVLGVLVALGLPVLGMVRGVVDLLVVGSLDLPRISGVLELPWEALVAGFVILVVAEAFRVGSAMREDLEGLV